eukprot:1978111-Amphidinium_carterae.1
MFTLLNRLELEHTRWTSPPGCRRHGEKEEEHALAVDVEDQKLADEDGGNSKVRTMAFDVGP